MDNVYWGVGFALVWSLAAYVSWGLAQYIYCLTIALSTIPKLWKVRANHKWHNAIVAWGQWAFETAYEMWIGAHVTATGQRYQYETGHMRLKVNYVLSEPPAPCVVRAKQVDTYDDEVESEDDYGMD